MKPILKIFFEDMWGYENYTFNPEDNYFKDLLSLKYTVVVDPKPDILIYSVFGNNNLKYNCKKLYFCGENYPNNFKHPSLEPCDISLSHHETEGKNYYFPLWVLFINWFNKTQPRPLPSNPTFSVSLQNLTENKETKMKEKFCCFINNNPIPDRIELFKKLSEYKNIDSYGSLYNNVGGALRGSEQDKINILSNYKFTIAFENSYHDGYNTEKIIQPFSVKCIPIYAGGKKVKDFFNTNAMIYANDFENLDQVVEKIKEIDKNEELYKKYISSSPFINNQIPAQFNPETILNWIQLKLNI